MGMDGRASEGYMMATHVQILTTVLQLLVIGLYCLLDIRHSAQPKFFS
jgi:hypothetical protein